MRRTLFVPQVVFPTHLISDDGEHAVFDMTALVSDVVTLAKIDGMTKAEFMTRASQTWDETSVEIITGPIQ